jgi:hypothetical protein
MLFAIPFLDLDHISLDPETLFFQLLKRTQCAHQNSYTAETTRCEEGFSLGTKVLYLSMGCGFSDIPLSASEM